MDLLPSRYLHAETRRNALSAARLVKGGTVQRAVVIRQCYKLDVPFPGDSGYRLRRVVPVSAGA